MNADSLKLKCAEGLEIVYADGLELVCSHCLKLVIVIMVIMHLYSAEYPLLPVLSGVVY